MNVLIDLLYFEVMMKISEQLQERLKKDLGLDVEVPQRVRRGVHGKCAGVWAWYARYKNYAGEIGSEDTMTQCVKAARLSTYNELSPPGTLIVNAEEI